MGIDHHLISRSLFLEALDASVGSTLNHEVSKHLLWVAHDRGPGLQSSLEICMRFKVRPRDPYKCYGHFKHVKKTIKVPFIFESIDVFSVVRRHILEIYFSEKG
jgi:hypothetical protein